MTLHKGRRLLGSRFLPRTIAARLILLVSLGTSLILAGILGFSHLRARALIEAEVASSARYLALASAHRVEAALNTTARVVEIMARQLEDVYDYRRQDWYQIPRELD